MVIRKWRAHRRLRAADQLADAQSELSRWGWSMKPSEIRKLEARIEKLCVKVEEAP